MLVFVLNCGSSSVKFEVFEDECSIAEGLVDRIGQPSAAIHYRGGEVAYRRNRRFDSMRDAISGALEACRDPEWGGVLPDLADIGAVGHRVVHGGERFYKPVVIDGAVIEDIEHCIPLAPLHNPANLEGIRICRDLLPDVPHVAVFDTAFHQSMAPRAYLYALPMRVYSHHRVRRYGFHGTSHQYVDERVRALTNRPADELDVVTCHLGNGASVAAIHGGQVLDTSMGMTPLEGLVMGTRCGDLDPSIVLHLMAEEHMSAAEAEVMLQKHSGLLGISGLSKDMRELEQAAKDGDRRAELAIEIFAYRLRKYIGAYAAVLGKLDAVVFTGGIGENSALVRELATEGLEVVGVALDDERNRNPERKDERRIDREDGRAEVWVIPTDEELVIARAARRLAG